MLLKKTKSLERKFHKFLDMTTESGLILLQGIKSYFKETEEFERHLDRLKKLEGKGDTHRREIETQLYEKTLIPESRGDVLALLENLDDIINISKDTLVKFHIEIPKIDKKYHDSFIKLTEYSINAVTEVVNASRVFIEEPYNVKNYIHKVYYWEKECDAVAEQLKIKIFRDDSIKTLSQKFHLRDFTDYVDMVADQAEDVADRLSIFAIKRSI